MLINAIDLVSLLVFIRAWIVWFFVRLIFASQDLTSGYVKSNWMGASSGEEAAYPSGVYPNSSLGSMLLNFWYSL